MDSERLVQWISTYEEVWLFGTGIYGKSVNLFLRKQGITVKGFVVSVPKHNHTGTGEMVVDIVEFEKRHRRQDSIGLVIAVGCRFYNDIIPKLGFCAEDLFFLEEREKHNLTARWEESNLTGNPYDSGFYGDNLENEKKCANELVQAITTFVQPKTVVDVGCGAGLIGHTFMKHGAQETFGIDGDYVDRAFLQLDEDHFIPHDLTKPFETARRYDLAISLEVAEHLPPKHAEQFVRTLCSLSDVVVFSAATPGQGGVLHVNEQLQSYWAQLFEDQGYRAVDCIRPLIWNNQIINDFYKQNILLYVKSHAESFATLVNYVQQPILDTVHPELFRRITDLYQNVL